MTTDVFNNFSRDIRTMMSRGDVDAIDAVVTWCESNGVEIELAAQLIKKDHSLKYLLEKDAEDLNYIEKRARLPI